MSRSDAVTDGIISVAIYYFDEDDQLIRGVPLHNEYFYPWRGYLMLNQKDYPVYLLTGNNTNPYTLTFRYKSESFTVGQDNNLTFKLEGSNFIVSSDNKITFRYLIKRLTRILSGRWR